MNPFPTDVPLHEPATWAADCQALGLSLSPEHWQQISQLYTLLLTANAQTNLTRLTSPEAYLYKHILDSLTIINSLPEGAQVIDLGSGAGFPALPLAIVRPDLTITAVESVGKKCRFIQESAAALSLTNLNVINDRAEALGQRSTYRERFDVVTARALAPLPVLLEYAIPLVTYPQGRFLAFKGSQYTQELENASQALKTLHAKLDQTQHVSLEQLPGAVILHFKKTTPTPPAYPRAVGLPAKKPL